MHQKPKRKSSGITPSFFNVYIDRKTFGITFSKISKKKTHLPIQSNTKNANSILHDAFDKPTPNFLYDN